MIHLQNLLDDAKCYARVRELRWPEGVRCPHCASATVTKQGRDVTQRARQKYRCATCGRHFDDLTGTVLAGHHQPVRVWILCLYLMGLNLSNQQIGQELGLNKDDVQRMTSQLRAGIVAAQPEVQLAGEVECDEVYVVAGHKGHPEAVKKRPERPPAPPQGSPGARHLGQGETAHPGADAAGRRGGDPDAGECSTENHSTAD